MPGPLSTLRVIEMAGLGPTPHAGMVLADLGAEVVRVDRPSGPSPITGLRETDLVNRNRRSVDLDLKSAGAVDDLMRMVERADVFIEGFRPGVAERLGVGPDACLERNPGLIYGRMTGWGQTGPLAPRAGHDINYISINGVLDAIGRPDERPVPPVNFVGDYGGGSMLLTVGILAALFERGRSGLGQVIDAAMVDGSALLSQIVWSLSAQGLWRGQRGTNLIDGGAPFYDTYRCSDDRFVAVGALEPQFYRALLEGLGLVDDPTMPPQHDRSRWPELRTRLVETFEEKPRDEWAEIFGDTDACVTPVLSRDEALTHPHIVARDTIVEVDDIPQAGAAPRFSRTPADSPTKSTPPESVESILADWE